MGSLSIFHWLVVIIYVLGVIIPFWAILPRAGLPRVLSLIMPIIPLNIIVLWVLAFKRWPGDARGTP